MIIFIREKDDYMVELECHSVSYCGDCLEIITASGYMSVYPIGDIFGFQIIK